MSKLTSTAHSIGIVAEFFGFLWRQRLWWLIPLFVVIFPLGLLLVLGQTSALAPFIYTLF